MNKLVRHEVSGKVSVLSLTARPHNFMGPRLLDEILDGLSAAEEAGSRAVVIKSALKNFSAGAEVEFLEELRAAARDGSRSMPYDVAAFLARFEAFRLPVIASIHGVCVGGGFELASACDMIVAAKSTKIGCVEVGVALHPLMGAVQRIAQRAGALRAGEMALLGRRYDAATLERWGLINLVTADDQLESVTMTIASEIAAGPTIAHVATKKLIRAAVDCGVAMADAAMSKVQLPIWTSKDLDIGLEAYRTGDIGLTNFQGS